MSRSEQLRERVRRSLLTRMRERGLQPPGRLDEMAEMVVAHLVESGRLGWEMSPPKAFVRIRKTFNEIYKSSFVNTPWRRWGRERRG